MKNFTISTKKSLLNIPLIHDFICNRSYWGKGRSFEMVEKSIQNSLCFGVYDDDGKQVGFARVITDYAVFAYILDVFVLEEYRGNGLGKLLMKSIMEYSDLSDVKRFSLGTDDAHGLYSKFGFKGLDKPENAMKLIRK